MDIKNTLLFRKKELLHFCTYRFIFGISYSFMIPIIPLFFESRGISIVAIGTIMSLYGVSKALTQIPFGLVSDSIGDKLTLIISLALITFIPILYTVVHSRILSGGVYVLQGAILGMAAPATFSILSRSLDEGKRGESTGLASAVFTLGGGIGAAIGGYIVAVFNNYNIVFYLSSVGILITTIFIVIKIKKTDYKNKDNKNKKSNKDGNSRFKVIIKDIKRHKLGYKIIMLGSIAFLGDFIFGCVGAIFPFYGQEVLGGSIGYTSTIMSIYLFSFGIVSPIGCLINDKIGSKKQLLISFIVMDMALLGLSLVRGIIIFTLIIIVYFLAATFFNSSLQSLLSEFGENDNIKGIVFGFVGASEAIGYAVGPITAAFIYNLNKSWLFLGLLIISVAISITYIFLYKKAAIN